MLLLFLFFLTFSIFCDESNFLTPIFYKIKLTPGYFGRENFSAHVEIHVNVTGTVKEFDLNISKDIHVEKIAFWQAPLGYSAMSMRPEIQRNDDNVHVVLRNRITQHDISRVGYILVDYKGRAGKEEANKGLHFINEKDYEIRLKNGSAMHLFPILKDVPAPMKIVIVTPLYHTDIKSNLPIRKDEGIEVVTPIWNIFKTGSESIKLSDVYFKIESPEGSSAREEFYKIYRENEYIMNDWDEIDAKSSFNLFSNTSRYTYVLGAS